MPYSATITIESTANNRVLVTTTITGSNVLGDTDPSIGNAKKLAEKIIALVNTHENE